MTPQLGSAASALVIQRLTGTSGVNASLATLTLSVLPPLLDPAQIRTGNIAPELAERSNTVRYPAANIYCEKIVNSQVEKFRTFSGTMQMAIDLRHSEDRVDNVQAALETYADAVMGVLNTSSGDWGGGLFYGGGYQVAFGPVKHGGKNFIQTAKITFEIGVSIS
jgi:hypothetical protein